MFQLQQAGTQAIPDQLHQAVNINLGQEEQKIRGTRQRKDKTKVRRQNPATQIFISNLSIFMLKKSHLLCLTKNFGVWGLTLQISEVS